MPGRDRPLAHPPRPPDAARRVDGRRGDGVTRDDRRTRLRPRSPTCCRPTSTTSSPTAERAAVEARLEESAEWRAELAEVESATRDRARPARRATRPPGSGTACSRTWNPRPPRSSRHPKPRSRPGADHRGARRAARRPRDVAARPPGWPAPRRRWPRSSWSSSMPGQRTVKPNVTAVATQHGASTANSGDPISGLVPVGVLGVRADDRTAHAPPLACVAARAGGARRAAVGGRALHVRGCASRTPAPRRELVEQMRAAPLAYDFAGVVESSGVTARRCSAATVTVSWRRRQHRGRRRPGRVVDDGATTYVLGKSGWTSVGVTATPANLPRRGSRMEAHVAAGPTIAGRPTTTCSRRATATGRGAEAGRSTRRPICCCERQVRDHGRLERSLKFTALTVGAGGRRPRRHADRRRPPSSSVPDGFRAPRDAGRRLRARGDHGSSTAACSSRTATGCSRVSILEQRGALDWDALPAGGNELRDRRAPGAALHRAR